MGVHSSPAARWIPAVALTGATVALAVAIAGLAGAIRLSPWQEAVLVAGALLAAGLGIAEHRGARADEREP